MWSSICTELGRPLGLGLVAALVASAQPARASELHVAARAARAALPVHSLRSLRFGATVRQSRDFSCGAAAVATLLTYHMGESTSEDEIFDALWEAGDREVIAQRGFSLLDLKTFLASRGHATNGYRITLDQLREAGVPALALLSSGAYQHFVVVKGIDDTHVVVGDPAQGTRIVPRAAFEALRDEILLVALPRPGRPRPEFNAARDWRSTPEAPLPSGAAALTPRLMRPIYNEF